MKKLLFILLPATLLAQPTVAPTTESVGSNRGKTAGDYNIRNSFETGYRFADVEGNEGKYRSDVNFLNGLRLLGSSLSVNSRDGKGKYFDELILNTQGLGNDPYQFASLRVEKNRSYRYEMNWRLNDYFNPGLTIAFGQHWQNLERRMQDHQFTLFPQNWIQFYGGYSRNSQDGPAMSTANLFDARGNVFPYFQNVRRQQNEYRVGGQVEGAGMKLFWQRGWEQFKEDTRGTLDGQGIPLDPTITTTTLTGLRKDEPIRGTTPHWRVNLFSERQKWFTINGRFTYSSGSRDFVYDEMASGGVRSSPRNVQTLVYGNARRPVTSASLSFSLMPTDRITISNHTAFAQTRMEGDNNLRQLTNGSLDFTILNFQFLGIRTITNSSLLDVALRRWISLEGGYQFSERQVRSTEQAAEGSFGNRLDYEQSNRLNAGTAGFRLRPIKGLTIVADGELGRQSRPFYATSEKDYHAFGARAEYKLKHFRFAAQARNSVNFNSISLFRHSARSRNFTMDGSWVPNTRFAVDAGYQKLHLDTVTGIAYFLNFSQVNGESSYFVSNVHAVHAGIRMAIFKRLDLYGGFASSNDTGSGKPGYTTQPELMAAQAFPLIFLSPQVRLSFKFNDKLRWNFGYQYYDYAERMLAQQDYRAHTGYASVLWSF